MSDVRIIVRTTTVEVAQYTVSDVDTVDAALREIAFMGMDNDWSDIESEDRTVVEVEIIGDVPA